MAKPRIYLDVQFSDNVRRWVRHSWWYSAAPAVDAIRRLYAASDSSGKEIFSRVRLTFCGRVIYRDRHY